MNHSEVTKMLAILGQENRLHIYKLLLKEGGLSVGLIANILHIPIATLSFHLSAMVNAKILTFERKGRVIIYSANTTCLEIIKNYIEQ